MIRLKYQILTLPYNNKLTVQGMSRRENQKNTRRAILRSAQQDAQYMDIPVQVQHQRTYSSIDNELQYQLHQQIKRWKNKYYHMEDHLARFQDFKERYEQLTRRNRLLETQGKEKEYEIEYLSKEVEKKGEEIGEIQQKKKQEIAGINRCHKEEVDKLKDELEEVMGRLAGVESEERKSKRGYEKELGRLREALGDANDQLEVGREALERVKGEGIVLKKKIQDLEMNREQVETSKELVLRIETLSGQLKLKEQELWRERKQMKGMEAQYKLDLQFMTKSLQQNDLRTKKLILQLDRLKLFQTQSLTLQRQLVKLNKIILTKNQEIDILLYKIDSSANNKLSGRTNIGSVDEEYYNEFSKLQQEISEKQQRHRREKEELEEKVRGLEMAMESRVKEKSKVIEEKCAVIQDLEIQLERAVRGYEFRISNLESSSLKSTDIIQSLRRELDESELSVGKLKVALIRMEDSCKLLEHQRDELGREKRLTETECVRMASELREVIKSNIYKENYEGINRKDLEQLYEAKMSSKDELIELLRLKLRSYEGGVMETSYRTPNSFNQR